ncbi:protein EFR3 homolog A isoform X1 [Tanacetum coccineum]|uniref:Protein EFR3 homolog A isoform X1 n=1 Tax=Tanacetum coccineum TaxID=301880 RepID=A0ABQ5FB65_9ASTR
MLQDWVGSFYLVNVITEVYCTLIACAESQNVDGTYSYNLAKFSKKMVNVILVNYDRNTSTEQDDERGEAHLIGEEAESPKVWAQICIQRMVELAKESTTMRRIWTNVYYFDTNRQWVPPNGLGLIVLSDMAYFVESPVVHHLDHKNISHDPELKSYVIQTTTALAQQVRSEVALKDIGYVSDLCRHLRKSLQATVESVGELELSLNTSLQSSIEDCLLEIAKGVFPEGLLLQLLKLMRWSSDSASVFASVTCLLNKLQKEKDGTGVESEVCIQDGFMGKENAEQKKEECVAKRCPQFQKLSAKNPNDNLVVRIFQHPLSLLKLALDHGNGMLCPAHQRSLVTLSTAMLMFAAKMYQIHDMLCTSSDANFREYVDNYLSISDDFQVYMKASADVNRILYLIMIISVAKMEAEELRIQLFDTFTPEDAMFGPESMLHLDHSHRVAHSKESLSFDTEFPTNSLVEDDASSDSSVSDLSRFITKSPTPSSMSHVISIRQLLDSALEAAGQVAGAPVSTSPLPFSAMAGQCEALGTDSRKKLSTWLSHTNGETKSAEMDVIHVQTSNITKILGEDEPARAGTNGLRLPPASPFDNFLKAARYA